MKRREVALRCSIRMRVLVAAASALASAPLARAQDIGDFYKGKTIELDIGLSVGGAYDAYARMLARSMGKYIPGNPAIVPRTMEGAGSMRLANYLSNAAPRDGTTFGTINRGTAFEPLFGGKGGQFDATKFGWIGSTNNEISVCVTWHSTGVTTVADARRREVVVGATGPSTDTYQYPKLVNALIGTRFKIVTGYPGGNDVDLAMERGEVEGRCSWSWTSLKGLHQAWVDNKQINILYQMGLSKHRDLPDVPLVIDLAGNDEDRAVLKAVFARQVMAWPFLAPPGTPPERLDVLRRAFMQTTQDKDFLAEAAKAGLEITPVKGEDIQKLVQQVYAAPAAIAERAARLMQ
jgi:tripartite-type tricarboxylate transporter receptor subunit TctC